WRGGPTTGLEVFRGSYYPDLDIDETDDKVVVHADLPGMTEKDIDVRLSPDGDELILSGERKDEREQRGPGTYRSERSWGSFQRTVGLPCRVVEDNVDAHFKNGVLTVELPKTPDAKKAANRIAVKAD